MEGTPAHVGVAVVRRPPEVWAWAFCGVWAPLWARREGAGAQATVPEPRPSAHRRRRGTSAECALSCPRRPTEITQEAASKGLTLIYSLGDKSMQVRQGPGGAAPAEAFLRQRPAPIVPLSKPPVDDF